MPMSDEQRAEIGHIQNRRGLADAAYHLGIDYGRQVRKLLWTLNGRGNYFESGRYRVKWVIGDEYRVCLMTGEDTSTWLAPGYLNQTAAKAVAQQHYNALILGALEPI